MENNSNPYSLFVYALNSPVTRERYTTRLNRFFTFLGLQGTIEERCKAFVEKGKDNDWVFQNVIAFLQHYRERVDRKEVTASTIRNYVKAIKLFCEMNDILLPWKKITRGLPRGRKWANDRAPSLEELRKLVQYPDWRIKAIVTTTVSSGIRLGAWDYLKWRHVKPIEVDGKVVCACLYVYEGDEEEYLTFITPEAYTALKQWMDYRQRSGEEVTEESWLMRNLWDNRITHGKGWPSIPKKLKASGVKVLVENALWTQGIRKKLNGKRRHEFQAMHGMRKYFKSRAEQIMKPINVEILMGHSTGVSDSYYRPTFNELLQDYIKAVALLTISETEEVRREMIQQEKAHQIEISDVRSLVENLQGQVSFLSSAVLSAKVQALQGQNQSQDRTQGTS